MRENLCTLYRRVLLQPLQAHVLSSLCRLMSHLHANAGSCAQVCSEFHNNFFLLVVLPIPAASVSPTSPFQSIITSFCCLPAHSCNSSFPNFTLSFHNNCFLLVVCTFLQLQFSQLHPCFLLAVCTFLQLQFYNFTPLSQ